mmetsp:Transcript_3331/g.4112  ORF Transcript_3331/g.4112 Transcript_3331/m.4112 type:complete len:93 (-) Transcript_3331:415-693(-)
MYQQTSKDIFKNLGRIIKGKSAKRDFKYLNDLQSIIGKKHENSDLSDIENLLSIIKASALFQILRTSKLLGGHEEIRYATKWNKLHLLDIVK